MAAEDGAATAEEQIAATGKGEAMRSEHEVDRALSRYADMVRRICLLHLKNYQDTEDVFQTVFLKYLLYTGAFADDEHEKAWFARVAINACKDLRRSYFRRNTVPLDALSDIGAAADEEQTEVLTAVLSLPPKYKDVVYLFYYEGYSAVEIAKILHKNENTVYSLLSRARGQLRTMLGGEAI